MAVKRLPQKVFDKIYSRAPRLCVDIIIKNNKGLLLTKRAIPPDKGVWHVPGGTVLYTESLDGAVKRVAEEELGVEVNIKGIIAPVEFFPNKSPHGHAVSIVHLCEPIGKPKAFSQASEVKFFKKLPKNIIPEQKQFILGHHLLD